MEAPEGDNEYMIMDADQWDNQDDTYENGDTQEEGPDSRNEKNEKKKGKAATNTAQQIIDSVRTGLPSVPLPDRYMTIRRPALGKNRGLSKRNKLVFFRSASVWLVALCTVLIGVLIALSIIYYSLAGVYIKETEQIDKLREENRRLKRETEITANLSRLVYRISSTEYPSCLSGNDLVVLNYHVLEEHVQNGSFYLFQSRLYAGSCYNEFAWYCKC